MGLEGYKDKNRIQLRANGKINLSIDVIGKRPDGYHEVEMVMQSIDLWDEIELKKIRHGVELICNMADLPMGEGNIAYRAAMLLKEKFGVKEGVRIKINKRIPLGAGMGGGSADCAGVLVGLNLLWNLGLKPKELEGIGRTLGADVPFCIKGGTAVARGIGEKLTPIRPKEDMWIVLIKPEFSVSTEKIYEGLELQKVKERPDTGALVESLISGNKGSTSGNLVNVLETATIPIYPEIEIIKSDLLRHGALGSLMTGSGPSVFGIFEDQTAAKKGTIALENKYEEVYCLRTSSKGIIIKS